MADITYCDNVQCPFTDCERYLRKAPRGIPVSIARFAGTCRQYIGWLVDESYRELRSKTSREEGGR